MVRPPQVFARRARRDRPPRLRGLTINKLLPNLLTLTALASGITGVRFAIDGQFDNALIAILVAALFDGLDGRIARLLKAQSKFGEELDSLSDMVSFGVAPALILYMWSLQDARSLGWIAAIIYAVCTALRLARFNTAIGAAEKPPWAYNYFTGVPSPAAAGLVMLPLAATLELGPGWFDHYAIVLPWTVLVAALMVSNIPTFSMKGQRIPQHYVLFLLLGVGILAAGLATATWATLTVVGLLYLATLPFSYRQYSRLRSQAERLVSGEQGSAGETNATVTDQPPAVP
jgi:CDP-diacylglycerol---serine O-phosphatidyltransferase